SAALVLDCRLEILAGIGGELLFAAAAAKIIRVPLVLVSVLGGGDRHRHSTDGIAGGFGLLVGHAGVSTLPARALVAQREGAHFLREESIKPRRADRRSTLRPPAARPRAVYPATARPAPRRTTAASTRARASAGHTRLPVRRARARRSARERPPGRRR